MMPDPDTRIRAYYQDKCLSEESIIRILHSRPSRAKHPLRIALAMAASVVLLTLSGLWIGRAPPLSLEQVVAQEVWKNHRKALASEVDTASFAEIQAGLPRLGFTIAPTRPEMLAGLELQGGRYCSIQEELAAQVHLVDGEGQGCTLYIAPMLGPLAELSPGIHRVPGGGQVEIWQDAHRIFALARDQDL